MRGNADAAEKEEAKASWSASLARRAASTVKRPARDAAPPCWRRYAWVRLGAITAQQRP